MKNVCAIIGDFYHNPETLAKALENLPDRNHYELVLHSVGEGFPRRALEQADLLVLARMGRSRPEASDELWCSEHDERLIFDFVERGGGLIALHAALASYPPNGPLRMLLRGRFLYHPPLHPAVQYVLLEPKREVTCGVEGFTVEDEQYFVEVEAKITSVFLRSSTPEHGDSPAGWAHQSGHGRACVLVPGHTEAALFHPMMQRLLQNAFAWCTRSGV